MPTRFRASLAAIDRTKQAAQRGLRPAARAIADQLPQNVPLVTGGMRRSYRPSVDEQPDAVRVYVGSPFWHWLEYGTQHNPAYRPVERTVRALGLRWVAQ